MKKIEEIKKIFVLTIVFMLSMTVTCFADVVFSPVAQWRHSMPYFNIVIIILGVMLVIALVCALIGEIIKSEQLKVQALKVSEQIAYYFLVVIGIAFMVFELSVFIIFGIIPFTVILCSLYCRLATKRKGIAYCILVVYYIVVVALFIASRY